MNFASRILIFYIQNKNEFEKSNLGKNLRVVNLLKDCKQCNLEMNEINSQLPLALGSEVGRGGPLEGTTLDNLLGDFTDHCLRVHLYVHHINEKRRETG